MKHPADPKALSAYWRQHVDAGKASGLSCAQFCKANDINYHRFIYWRQKFEAAGRHQNSPSETGGFAAVRVQPDGHCELSLSLPNGLVVRGICADNVAVVRQLLNQVR